MELTSRFDILSLSLKLRWLLNNIFSWCKIMFTIELGMNNPLGKSLILPVLRISMPQ